jgi:hypothetical protein
MASFQTKNPNWVNLGRSWFKDAGIFYGHLFFFTASWYSLCPFDIIVCSFGIFLSILVCCTKKNLATLVT